MDTSEASVRRSSRKSVRPPRAFSPETNGPPSKKLCLNVSIEKNEKTQSDSKKSNLKANIELFSSESPSNMNVKSNNADSTKKTPTQTNSKKITSKSKISNPKSTNGKVSLLRLTRNSEGLDKSDESCSPIISTPNSSINDVPSSSPGIVGQRSSTISKKSDTNSRLSMESSNVRRSSRKSVRPPRTFSPETLALPARKSCSNLSIEKNEKTQTDSKKSNVKPNARLSSSKSRSNVNIKSNNANLINKTLIQTNSKKLSLTRNSESMDKSDESCSPIISTSNSPINDVPSSSPGIVGRRSSTISRKSNTNSRLSMESSSSKGSTTSRPRSNNGQFLRTKNMDDLPSAKKTVVKSKQLPKKLLRLGSGDHDEIEDDNLSDIESNNASNLTIESKNDSQMEISVNYVLESSTEAGTSKIQQISTVSTLEDEYEEESEVDYEADVSISAKSEMGDDESEVTADEDEDLLKLQQIQPEFNKSLIKLEERYSKEFFARHVLFEVPGVGERPSKTRTKLSFSRRSEEEDSENESGDESDDEKSDSKLEEGESQIDEEAVVENGVETTLNEPMEISEVDSPTVPFDEKQMFFRNELSEEIPMKLEAKRSVDNGDDVLSNNNSIIQDFVTSNEMQNGNSTLMEMDEPRKGEITLNGDKIVDENLLINGSNDAKDIQSEISDQTNVNLLPNNGKSTLEVLIDNEIDEGDISLGDNDKSPNSSVKSEDLLMASKIKIEIDEIDFSTLNDKENALTSMKMKQKEKIKVDDCEDEMSSDITELPHNRSDLFDEKESPKELEKQENELDEKAENLIENYFEWFETQTDQVLSILGNSNRYSTGKLQKILSTLKFDKGKRTILFGQIFHKSEIEILLKILNASKTQVSTMISSKIHDDSAEFMFFNESKMEILKLAKFPTKKFLKCHSVILQHVDKILLLGYLCLLAHFKPIGRQYRFIVDYHLNSMTKLETTMEELLEKGFYDPGNKFIYQWKRKLLGFNVHAVVIHYGQINGQKIIVHDEDDRKNVLIDGLKKIGMTVDEICIADEWSEEDKSFKIEAGIIMLNQTLELIEAKHDNYKIFLICFDISGDFAHLISQAHPNLFGIINFGFRTFNSKVLRGIPGDSICNTECPSLFILGEKSKYSNLKHLRTFKENFKMPIGSIIVGNADHHLKISNEILMKKKISQACVDRIILEHVADFLDICCVSRDDMEPNGRCQSPFDIIIDTDENFTDEGIKEKNQIKEKKISKRTITKTTEEDRRKFQDILGHIRESDSGKTRYKQDLTYYPWLKERPKLPEINGINFEALDAALAAPNPEDEMSPEPYERESSFANEDRMTKHEEKMIKAELRRRRTENWKKCEEENRKVAEVLKAAEIELQKLEEDDRRKKQIPRNQPQPRRPLILDTSSEQKVYRQTSFVSSNNRVNYHQSSSSTSSVAYAVPTGASTVFVPYSNTRVIYQPIRVPYSNYQQVIVTSMPQNIIQRQTHHVTQLRQIRPHLPTKISIVKNADYDDQLSPEM